MENFYRNDKSGNKKKFDYMFKHHPIITNNILSWAKDNGLYGLPFDELSYLKFNNITSVPMDDNGYKTFKGWSKGYSVRGKYSNLNQKFIDNNVINFINKLSDEDLLVQRKCGKISQIILNNYIFIDEINRIIE